MSLFLFIILSKRGELFMLDVSRTNNFMYRAKVASEGLVTVVAEKLEDGLIQITYFGNGFSRVLKTASILACRMIASLMGADYQEVNKALNGVA